MDVDVDPNPSSSTPAERMLSPLVRRSIVGRSLLIAAAASVIVWVLVAIACRRFPIFGWTPIFVGLAATLVASAWAYWYFRTRWFFARHGVAVIATVVQMRPGGRHHERRAVFSFDYAGQNYRFSLNDTLMAWREGLTFAILIDPRDPDRWLRRDEVLGANATP